MIERVETARGLRISFRPESGIEEELRNLVAVENECCAWAEWTVATNAEQVVLDVSSSGEGIATLHSMFTSFQPDGNEIAFTSPKPLQTAANSSDARRLMTTLR